MQSGDSCVLTCPDETLSGSEACISVILQIVEIKTDGGFNQYLLKDVTLNPLHSHIFIYFYFREH